MERISKHPDEDQLAGRVTLPWVERVAAALVRGELSGLAEYDRDEVVAILRAAVDIICERTRQRPCARRRRAA